MSFAQAAEGFWTVLKELCQQAYVLIPGSTGAERKQWVIDKVCELADFAAVLLGIAKWANLQVVNGLERLIIGLGVERAWTELKLAS